MALGAAWLISAAFAALVLLVEVASYGLASLEGEQE